MEKFGNSPFDRELEVIATLRDRVIEASIAHNSVQSDLYEALVAAMRCGVGVDELSDVSGLTPEQIRRLEEKISL